MALPAGRVGLKKSEVDWQGKYKGGSSPSPSPTSKHAYTESEQIVGTYNDKDVYEITITGTSFDDNVIAPIAGIESIIECNGSLTDATNAVYTIPYYLNSSSYAYIFASANDVRLQRSGTAIQRYNVTLRYTKK